MRDVLFAACALGCPVSMGLMMWLMRGSKQQTPAPAESSEVRELREELARQRLAKDAKPHLTTQR